jgi:phenylacetate-CoA ligase
MLGPALFHLAHRLRGSQSLELLPALLAGMRRTPDEARRFQLERLRELLGHAERHVPYYRETFRAIGFRAADLRDADELRRLPVLTKDVIRERLDDLVDERVDRATVYRHNSGGSTGVPLSFYRDRSALDYGDAAKYRAFWQCGWRPGDMVAYFWGFNEKLERMGGLEFEARQTLRRFYQFDPFQSGEAEMRRWAAVWRRIRPTIAFGYASTLVRFAQFVRAERFSVPRIRGVFTTAEKLLAPQRADLEAAFGCKVFDMYGSSEVNSISFECVNGRMHVATDLCALETLSGAVDGAEAEPLLVTSLTARAMPLVRYRNEDTGRVLGAACDCGLGFPLMDLAIARQSDNFPLPNGRVVHGEYFTHLMYGTRGVDSFQFHQTAVDRIVLYVTGARGVGTSSDVARVVREAEALAPGQLAVEVREVETIALSSAGKHRFTRSDVRHP